MNTKMKTNKRTLMFKTTLTLIIFSIFILLIMYSFQLLFSNYYYETHKINEVKTIVKNISKNIDSIDTYLHNVSTESDICIELVLDNGSILYNDRMKGCLLNNNNIEIKKLKNKMISSSQKTVSYKITNPLYNNKSYILGTKLSDDTYVFINSQLESLDNTYIVLRNQIIYLLIIVICLSIVMSFIISNMITKPIIEITEKAKKMGKGDLKVVFESSNISEIDELSKTLNYTKNEMIKMDDYRKDLIANVSHDLKTPLTLIKSYAEMVKDITYKDEQKRNENLDIIINETDRLTVLVNDILTLSKIEANVEVLKIEEYDLVKQIEEIIKKFSILSQTEDYKFIYDGPKKALVKADREKINQVIYNLVNNAINYTGENQCIYINVKSKLDKYLVEIIDTGKGIEKENIDHIWDRYYKTEKKHKRNKVGTGLGLSIVKNILEAHKFEYNVKSEKDKYTNFYFFITKK